MVGVGSVAGQRSNTEPDCYGHRVQLPSAQVLCAAAIDYVIL